MEKEPKFLIINSNDLSLLSKTCTQIMKKEPLLDPFAKEELLVMNYGMRTYLTQEIAKENGIAACCSYKQPWQLIFDIYKKVFNVDDDSDHTFEFNAYDKNHITLNLLALKSIWNDPNHKEFIKLQEYIKNDHTGQKEFMLADKIADVYDQYQMYRPEWILFFNSLQASDFDAFYESNGKSGAIFEFIKKESKNNNQIFNAFKNNIWQFHLWCLLQNNLACNKESNKSENKDLSYLKWSDRSTIVNKLINTLINSDDVVSKLVPQRLFIFGVSSLPAQVINFLYALSYHTQIYFMLLNPCQEYWGDLSSNWRQNFKSFCDKIKSKPLDSNIELHTDLKNNGHKTPNLKLYAKEDGDLIEGNSLLLSFGQQCKDLQYLLLDQAIPGTFIDIFAEDNDKGSLTLLQIIQRQLRTINPPANKEVISYNDRSLQIHSCHTLKREVEVLKDAILNVFKVAALRQERLRPRDIVVMVPAINKYAPYIEAIFGQIDSNDPNYIPYAISDRTDQEQSPLINSVLALLSICKNKVTNSLIIELLSVESIAKRFGIEQEDVSVISSWISDNHIYWGIDESDTQKYSDIPLTTTFSSGLDRMIYGLMSGIEGESSFTQIEGSDGLLLGKLWRFIYELDKIRQTFNPSLNVNKSPKEWGRALKSQILDRFYVQDDSTFDLAQIDHIINELETICSHFSEEPLITLSIFYAYLEGQLKAKKDFTPFLKDKINFCSLVPMRAVPFKHIFILGLNDLDFPRQDYLPSFNLTSIPGLFKRGDRSRNMDDKYLFLQAIIAAQESLYLSYIGQSPFDKKELNPSMVISELFDYLQENFELDEKTKALGLDFEKRFIIKERLFAYDDENYLKDNYKNKLLGYCSYDRKSCMSQGSLNVENSCLGLNQNWNFPKEYNLDVSIEELCGFFKSPCRYFLRKHLNIYLRDLHEDSFITDEPFFINNLVTGNILKDLLINDNKEQFLHNLQSNGSMPQSYFGAYVSKDLLNVVENIKESYDKSGFPPIEKISIKNMQFKIPYEGQTYKVNVSGEINLPIILYYLYGNKNQKCSIKQQMVLTNVIKSCLVFKQRNSLHNSYVIFKNGNVQMIKALESQKIDDVLTTILTFFVAGQNKALPLVESMLDSNELNLESMDFGYDEDCKYLFKTMDNVKAYEHLDEVLAFCDFYAELFNQVIESKGK